MYPIRDEKYNQCYTTLAFFLWGYPQDGVNNTQFFHRAFPSRASCAIGTTWGPAGHVRAADAEDRKQPIAFQVGVRYYAEKPNGSHGGLRFTTPLLFPKQRSCPCQVRLA